MFLGRKNFLLHWFGKFTVGRISTVPKHVGVVNNIYIYITSVFVGFHKVKINFSVTGLSRPLENRKAKASGFFMTFGTMKAVKSSLLRTGRLYPQEYNGTHF
jgi:hypothetical protein